MRQPVFRSVTAPLFLLLLGTPSFATEAGNRPCQPVADSGQPPRVRCEDTGDEYFFSGDPTRLPNASAWLCSTVQSHVTTEVTDTGKEGQLRAVSTETREERDRRTQTADLLKAAGGLQTTCWRTEEIGIDNPRARAEAERVRQLQEAEEAERRRQSEEARHAEQKKRDRILRPHRKPPSNPTDMLIRATTPPHLNDGKGPARMEACIAVDLSLSMAIVFQNLSRQFARIVEAWEHHYPEGVRITVVGYGQETPEDPYREFTLLNDGSIADFQRFLRGNPTRGDAFIEPTIDAVSSCSERVRFSSRVAGDERRQVALIGDEPGDRISGTPPQPWNVLAAMRSSGVNFTWINPREYGRCPEVLSTSFPAAVLEENYRKIVQSDLLQSCATSAIAFLLWHERGAQEAAALLNRILDVPPSQLWNQAGREYAALVIKLHELLPVRSSALELIDRKLDAHAEYLMALQDRNVELSRDTGEFFMWILFKQMRRSVKAAKDDLEKMSETLEDVQRDLEAKEPKKTEFSPLNPFTWFE